MKHQEEEFDYESVKKQTFGQFRSGKSLTGQSGAFAPLFKQFLEAALAAKLEQLLFEEAEDCDTNRKNGKGKEDGNRFQNPTQSL